MDSDTVSNVLMQQSSEFIDTICLDKSILLPDGCTSATITTADGESLPVTLIVSEPTCDEEGKQESFEESIATDDLTNQGNDAIVTVGNEDAESETVYAIRISDNLEPSVMNYEELQDNEVVPDEKNNNLSMDLSADSNQSENQFSPDPSDTATRLEDFMDVVTTYKCKFCRFACPWKSGLMSHIRCCHVEERKKIDALNLEKSKQDDHSKKQKRSNLSPKLIKKESFSKESGNDISKKENCKEDEGTIKGGKDISERHIFLCGQCSDGFVSLEACKEHMIKDHNLKLEQREEKPLRKRGRPRTRPFTKPLQNDELIGNGKETKRQCRPPKNLDEDYDFGVKPRKPRRETMNEKVFRCTCSGCSHRFSTESFLQYHYVCHSDDGKPFMCPDCKEEFDHWRGLTMHLWKEHSVDIDLHSCIDCDYKTYSYFKLDNHRKIHGEERAFVCDTCSKGFKQISQLRNHLVIHLDRKNLPEKRWYSKQTCETCGRTFSDTKCLRKHQQSVHSKLKPYVCSYCGHLSARKAMLELHMRQHTGEKPFICEHCDYRTGDHNSLRRHRMRHTGAKPYKCPHCPYACIQAISYKTHLKNKHPGMEGLFACSLCTFKSVSKENYVNHMSDHKCQTKNDSDKPPREIFSINQDTPLYSISNEKTSTEIHLPENALQQLEGILPGNITAAQLIYSCLNAISHEGGGPINLPPGVTVNIPPTTTMAADGTQTITIQLPAALESEDEPYYFTIQQQDGSTTAMLAPSICEKASDDFQPVTDMGDDDDDETPHVQVSLVESSILPNGDDDDDSGHLGAVHSESLVIAHLESFDESKSFSSAEVIDIEENDPSGT